MKMLNAIVEQVKRVLSHNVSYDLPPEVEKDLQLAKEKYKKEFEAHQRLSHATADALEQLARSIGKRRGNAGRH